MGRLTRFSHQRDSQGVGPDHTNVPDADLVGARAADAFAVVYDRHAEHLYRWARARVGDHAADLTAEVFARAWLRRRSFRDEADGSAFPCGEVIKFSAYEYLPATAANVRLLDLTAAHPGARVLNAG